MSDPIKLRSSGVSGLGDCAMRWEKQHLLGMTTNTSPPALVGTAVHASTAAYDIAQIDGSGGISIDDAAGVAIDVLHHPEEEVDWAGTNMQKAEERALRVHLAYCQEIAPHQSYTVIEHKLEPLLIEMENGVVFEITGTLDRIRQDEYGRQGVADVKTGIMAVGADGEVAVGKHKAQLGTYTLLAEQEFGPMTMPAGIIGLSTGSTARVGFREVTGAKESLIGSGDAPGFLHYVAPYFKSGLFPPNPQSWLCSPKFCPFYNQCNFHG